MNLNQTYFVQYELVPTRRLVVFRGGEEHEVVGNGIFSMTMSEDICKEKCKILHFPTMIENLLTVR
jgi:hypothetical protein